MLDTQKFHADDSGFYIDDFKLKGVKNISIDIEENSVTLSLTMHIPSSEINFSEKNLSMNGFALEKILFFSISSDAENLPVGMIEFKVRMTIQANEETQKEQEEQFEKELKYLKERKTWVGENNIKEG